MITKIFYNTINLITILMKKIFHFNVTYAWIKYMKQKVFSYKSCKNMTCLNDKNLAKYFMAEETLIIFKEVNTTCILSLNTTVVECSNSPDKV